MADLEEGDSDMLNLNVNKFLAEVQLYECLYNKHSRDIKNKYKKINCWTKIAEKVGLSTEAAEKSLQAFVVVIQDIYEIPSHCHQVQEEMLQSRKVQMHRVAVAIYRPSSNNNKFKG